MEIGDADMNIWYLVAGTLSVIVTALHVFGGGPEIHDPLLAHDLPDFLKAFVSILWHFVTLVLFTNSVALLYAARNQRHAAPLVLIVCAQYLLFVALFLFYGWHRLGNLTDMPQWSLFLLISAPALIGLKRARFSGVIR